MKKSKVEDAQNNAVSHGAYAQDPVLLWEDKQAFIDLHTALRDELEPDGPAEEEVVLGIAGNIWRKRRLVNGVRRSHHRHPDVDDLTKVANDVDDAYVGIDAALRGMAKSHAAVLENAFLRVNAMLTGADFSSATQSSGSGKWSSESQETLAQRQLDALTELTSALTSIGTSVIIPVLKIIESQDIEQSVGERAYRPDIIERELKVVALIDRQIEKGLTQLVHLKEYKRAYKKKQISSSGTTK
jgi:hypothetical protein